MVNKENELASQKGKSLKGMNMKKNIKLAFSIAEIVISMAIVGVVLIAAFYNIQKRQHRDVANALHGEIACYYDGTNLVGRKCITLASGAKHCDDLDECVFDNLPAKADFEVIVMGGGGGGGGSKEPEVSDGTSKWEWSETDPLGNIINTNTKNISVVTDISTSDFVRFDTSKVLPVPERNNDFTCENFLNLDQCFFDDWPIVNELSTVFTDEKYSDLFLKDITIEALGASGEGAFIINNNMFPENYLAVAPGGPGGKAVWKGDLKIGYKISSKIEVDPDQNDVLVSSVVIKDDNDNEVANFSAIQGASPYMRPNETKTTMLCPRLIDWIAQNEKVDLMQEYGGRCRAKYHDEVKPLDGTFFWKKEDKDIFDGLNCGPDPNGTLCSSIFKDTRNDFCCVREAGFNSFCDFVTGIVHNEQKYCRSTNESEFKKHFYCRCSTPSYKTIYIWLYKCKSFFNCKWEKEPRQIRDGCECRTCQLDTVESTNCGLRWHQYRNSSGKPNPNRYNKNNLSGTGSGNLTFSMRSDAEANKDITKWTGDRAKTYGARIKSDNNVKAQFASKVFSYEFNGKNGQAGDVRIAHMKTFPNNRIVICGNNNRNDEFNSDRDRCPNGYVGIGGLGGSDMNDPSRDGNTTCFGVNGNCTIMAQGGVKGINAFDPGEIHPNKYKFKFSAPSVNNNEPDICVDGYEEESLCVEYADNRANPSAAFVKRKFEANGDNKAVTGGDGNCNFNGNNFTCHVPGRGETDGYLSKYQNNNINFYYPVSYGGKGGPSAVGWDENLYVQALLSSEANPTQFKYVSFGGIHDNEPANDGIRRSHANGQRGGGGAIIIRW